MNVVAKRVLGLLDEEITGLRKDLANEKILAIDQVRLKRMVRLRKKARKAAVTMVNCVDMARSLGAKPRSSVPEAVRFSCKIHGHQATRYAHRMIVMVLDD